MLVECAMCEELFEVTDAVAIVCDYKADTVEYLCSEECVKEYPINVQKIYHIKVEKGVK